MTSRDRTTDRAVLAAVVCLSFLVACSRAEPAPLVVATTWPTAVLAEVEAAYRRGTGDASPIAWVPLVPGERVEVVLGRRGGVDVLLGGSIWEFVRLADLGKLTRFDASDHAPWRLIRRPRPVEPTPGFEPLAVAAKEYVDPRDDPATLAIARSILVGEGWTKGYETLVRRGSLARVASGRMGGETSALGPSVDVLEGLASLSTSNQASRSRRFVRWMAETAVVEAPRLDAIEAARADGLLADLLGSALVDAHDELRDAEAAIERFHRPSKAEAAIGESPPWPPASVARLMVNPADAPLAGQPGRADRTRSGFACLAPGKLVEAQTVDRRRLAPGDRVRPRWQAGAGASISWLAAGGVDGLDPSALSTGRARRRGLQPVMIRVVLENLVKRFDDVAVVDGASLEIRPGELTYILGPSGSGKTTLAKLITGLLPLDDGEIYFDGRLVHELPPTSRRVGLVFQDDALWPHWTVAENVGYPLKLQGLSRRDRRSQVAEALSTARLETLADKRPDALSGLQRQRVALARALILEPDLIILDDPLGRLEERVRGEFRDEIRRVVAEAETTTLVLTSDAKEALAIADSLAVMDLGRIVQSGTPSEVYNRPVDAFVARFLGPINLIQGQVETLDPRGEVVVRTPLGRLVARCETANLATGAPVTVALRPEALAMGTAIPHGANRFTATVERLVFLGEVRQVHLRCSNDWPVIALALQSLTQTLREGQGLTLHILPEHVIVLPAKYTMTTPEPDSIPSTNAIES